MTLKEYLEDYATEETKKKGLALIAKRLEMIPNPEVKKIVEDHLNDIDGGMRDFRL